MIIDSPNILIVTTKVDIATDYVIAKLAHLGSTFYRLNTEDLPLLASSTIRIEPSNGALSRTWGLEANRRVSLDNVTSIWYRRHRLPVMPEEMSNAHTEYCLREADWYLKGILLSFEMATRDIRWMSPPMHIQMAESKIFQLATARLLGFRLPDTIVSNDGDEIRNFFDKNEGNVIAKPLRLGYFDYGDRQTAVFTSRIHQGDLVDDRPLKLAPVIYQELLHKRFDIRVTVVDQDLFAVAIDSQKVPSAKVDWRKSDTDALEHFSHNLPTEVGELCLRLMEKLGLKYGAIDLVLTTEDEYYFLEINPNGQWAWLEDRLALPISNSIASWLHNASKD